ncbi:MAG: EscU/YscU/HrcU family type III secretion system export apparatus switch protein [Acetobacteraceae bacterium]|nr:EscU/YscU/HrcU family type III secretion system export apparatus switch protein [Acetobacteraceae bacterium]
MAEEDSAASAAERTEEPTPQRLRRAREEGQVALSREIVSGSVLLLAGGAAMAFAAPMGEALLAAARGSLARAHELPAATALRQWLGVAAWAVLPVGLAALLGAVGATMAQTRGLVSAHALRPDPSKLSPLAGFGRLFGAEGWLEFLRILIKLAVVGAALVWAAGDVARLAAMLGRPLQAIGDGLEAAALRLGGVALGAFALLALLDLLLVRFRHRQRLRMTRQELREELKETEGDPAIKARRRAIMERGGRLRMMQAVPRATVVITNPTHYAVALAYEPGQAAAPRLVAKGVDAMAARIREVAREAGVPVLSDPPLARALHRLELDTEIPAQHWDAVARILAFVLRRRGGG